MLHGTGGKMSEINLYKCEFRADRYLEADGGYTKAETGSCYILARDYEDALAEFSSNSSGAWEMHSICHLTSITKIQEKLFSVFYDRKKD